MHYKSNFLSKVVCRLDFADIPDLKGTERPEFSNRVAELYPATSAQHIAQLSVVMGPGGSSGVQQENMGMIWEHRKKPGGTMVTSLGPNFLGLEYGADDYDHFPQFRQELDKAYSEFQSLYHVAQIRRIGLRYINEIVLPKGDALDWDGLIKPDLITAVRAGIPKGMNLLRSFHQLQLKTDAATLVVHYGLFNPDYPNPIARRQFNIDIDASKTEVASGDAMKCIDQLNDKCEAQFESSIEDGLRKLMEIINE